jgi:hypothetical protein
MGFTPEGDVTGETRCPILVRPTGLEPVASASEGNAQRGADAQTYAQLSSAAGPLAY